MTVAVISRGIPGSGKSTFNRILQEMCKQEKVNIAIHSTDDYHMVDGVYVFNMAKLYQFHMRNLDAFTKSVNSGDVSIVVVDNTNLKAKEYKPYIEAARKSDNKVFAVRFEPDDVEKHFARQAHGVPLDRLVAMKESIIASGPTIGVDAEYVIKPDMFFDEALREICKGIISAVY